MVQQTINLYAWRENEKMIPPVLITQAAIAPGIVNDTRVMVRSGTDVLEIVGPRLYIAVGINASAIVSSSEFATLSAYMSDLSTYYQQVAAVQAGLTQTNENVSSLDSELTA